MKLDNTVSNQGIVLQIEALVNKILAITSSSSFPFDKLGQEVDYSINSTKNLASDTQNPI